MQTLHGLMDEAGVEPQLEAAMAGAEIGVALGQLRPDRTGSQHPKNPCENEAGIVRGTPAATAIDADFVKQRLDAAPLRICQFRRYAGRHLMIHVRLSDTTRLK